MTARSNIQLDRIRSKLPLLKVAYTELQYWLTGLTPESHHWAQGSAWEEYGSHRRAAKHLKEYLKYKDNTYARALLAYCYTRLSAWEDAQREYSTVILTWPDPSFSLALAEAHLHLGNIALAKEIVANTEAEHSASQGPALAGLDDIKEQLLATSKNTMEPT